MYMYAQRILFTGEKKCSLLLRPGVVSVVPQHGKGEQVFFTAVQKHTHIFICSQRHSTTRLLMVLHFN